MDKEEIAFKKMAMLMKAVTEANEQDDTLEELKAAAFEVLLLHPGCTYNEWATILTEQYSTELIDAFGTDPKKIASSIADMWDSEKYEDENTGDRHTYKEWAEYFATECSVELYGKLAEAKAKTKRFETQ